MPSLNILCPTCTETFQNADDVYSTSCGHLFHFRCLNEWQSRGTSCPQCRQHNPTTHKLYLSFDETETVEMREFKEIDLKLKTSNERITQIFIQKNEVESNFMELQKQYTDTTERLQDQLMDLNIENESIAKELNLKLIENETLKAILEEQNSSPSDSALNQKIKLLEQKLKILAKELEKEIGISTQLSIEKMKLECFIKHSNTIEKTEITEKAPQKQNGRNPEITEKAPQKQNGRNPNLKQNHGNNALEKPKPLSDILIRYLPLDQVTLPLEMIIVNLAAKMDMTVSQDDLISVNLVTNDNENYTKAQLVAKFKDNELRSKFLSKKSSLKNNKETRSIFISECMDDKLRSLYTYAKQKLYNNGYSHIYCKNNKLFAKKHRNHHKVVLIHDESQVDKLFTENILRLKATGPKATSDDNIDEDLSQL